VKPFIRTRMRLCRPPLVADMKDIDESTRRGITRVCNCILALANCMVPVSEDTIRRALEASNVYTNLADLLLPGNLLSYVTCLISRYPGKTSA
jgi:hypothetical protein